VAFSGPAVRDPPNPQGSSPVKAEGKPGGVVTARYPDHLFHVDLTVIPTAMGL
jgi:hypothetical protein